MANKIKNAFDSVKADSSLKESTMQYLAKQRARRCHPFPAVRRTLAAVCAMLILAAGIGGYSWVQTPVSYLSIDVNPSIELALNSFDRVVSAAAYNEQGESLLKELSLKELSLKGKKYTEAIDAVADSSILKEYLTPEEELVITVAADSSRKEKLLSGVQDCSGHIGHNCRSVSAEPDIVSDAHENGLSVGKYQAYLVLSQYDETVTVHDCRDMSMTEIHGRILEHEHGHENSHEKTDSQTEPETENTHHNSQETEQETQNTHHNSQSEEPETENTHHNSQTKEQKTENMQQSSQAEKQKTENMQQNSQAEKKKTENMQQNGQAEEPETENMQQNSRTEEEKTENMRQNSRETEEKTENMQQNSRETERETEGTKRGNSANKQHHGRHHE